MNNAAAGMLALILAATVPGSAGWAQKATNQPQTIRDVVDCISIADDTSRLRCFDRSAVRLSKDIEGRRIAVLDEEGVKQTRRSLFGFSLPAIGLFGKSGPNSKEDVAEIDGVVARLIRLPNQRFELVLGDGARWQTTEPAIDPYDVGDKVHIRRGALGSYWITPSRGRGVRGQRIG